MSKRPLIPSFLQSLDDKLLRNKPGTWTSRIHLVLYFVTVFAALLFVFCYFVFFDAKQYSNIGSWNTFVGLIVFVGFVFWLIYLLRFNVFKRYGNWNTADGLRDFVLYFTCIASMVAICFLPSAVETWRANQQFGNDEIVNDINELNVNACKLEYNLLPLAWIIDTCKVVNKTNAPNDYDNVQVATPVLIDSAVEETITYIPDNYSYIDTAELKQKLESADSVLKINDTAYVFYESPDYRFVSSYRADDYSTAKLLSSAAIYNSTVKYYKQPDKAFLLKRMAALKIKYAVRNPYSFNDYYNEDRNDSYDNKIRNKYELYRISNGIDNVVRKKYAWVIDWPVYTRIFYYITLLLTMLVFIFRSSTAKTFFLSVLTAILLTIISGLLLVVSSGDEESIILSLTIVYYVSFTIIALSVLRTRVRTAVQGIGLNLFLFMTPFIPLIFVALNEAMKIRRRYYEFDNTYVQEPDNSALYFLIAEVGGSLLLLILIQPLFKKLYRKWYSAPEE